MLKIEMWQPWSHARLVEKLPYFILVLDSNQEIMPVSYQEKNRKIVHGFLEKKLAIDDLREGARNNELYPLGFALDQCGREAVARSQDHLGEGLRLLHASHEIFRSVARNPPSREMRQTIQNAIRIVSSSIKPEVMAARIDISEIRECLRQLVTSAWGSVPPQLSLEIDELLFSLFEMARRSLDDDPTTQDHLIKNNVEEILQLEIPLRLEETRRQWEEIGRHVAPNATRLAARSIHRPQDLRQLLSESSWSAIRNSVERGSSDALLAALAEVEPAIEGNLRLRLDAEPSPMIPIAEVRTHGSRDRSFVLARDLLIKKDQRALKAFADLHFHKNANSIAKEWYAYALTIFGSRAEIHEINRLLKDAVESEFYRPEINWTARWNLACSLRRLPDRADEALDFLLPVLDYDLHTPECFQLCLLWALEQKRGEVLRKLLVRSPNYEAHLLAPLYEDSQYPGEAPLSMDRHFRRIGVILRDPDRKFPTPREELAIAELDDLTRSFIDNGLCEAGIEWFRQKLTLPDQWKFFKNWDCASRLNEEIGNFEAAWRCKKHAWRHSYGNRVMQAGKKTSILKGILVWASRHGFEEDALVVLEDTWESTDMARSDFDLWRVRLRGKTALPVSKSIVDGPVEVPPEGGPLDLEVAERTIQRLAGSFGGIARSEDFLKRRAEIIELIAAVLVKHPSTPKPVISGIKSIMDLGQAIDGIGISKDVDSDALARAITSIRDNKGKIPFDLSGLTQACERLAHGIAARSRATPDLIVTPPNDLHLKYGPPSDDRPFGSHILARIFNPGPEVAEQIAVYFVCTSETITISEEALEIPVLRPQERRIVDTFISLASSIETSFTVRVIVNYKSGGFPRSVQVTGKIELDRELCRQIPARYVTSGPVSIDRRDLFHGREVELRNLALNFSNARMLKLYFVNGIRAVGKSTLMRHLGAVCPENVLTLLLDVEVALGSPLMNARQLVRQLCRLAAKDLQTFPDFAKLEINLPTPELFELDPPWVVFDDFLEALLAKSGKDRIVLCLDELQKIVKRIADPEDPLDDGFLGWMREKIQSPSKIFVICTGSEPFGLMRRRYEQHTVWRNVEPFDVSFVSRDAMEKIATVPVKGDGVDWLPEALDRLWDYTEGHPSIIQMISELTIGLLNLERRRLVSPQDIDRAVDIVPPDSTSLDVWWNERDGMINATHRQIAFLILQNQAGSRRGLAEERLVELTQQAGIRNLGRFLDEMRALEVLTCYKDSESQNWKIRGAFLERHLSRLLSRALQESGIRTRAESAPLALMLDFENVKIGLSKHLKAMPSAKADSCKTRLEAGELGRILVEAASRHGQPRQKWAVADWDQQFFRGDQKLLRAARYSTEIAGAEKGNASDHVLREKIHFVLREHPEIEIFVIGTGDSDFHETIKTLQEKGKAVVLWAGRESINRVYGESLSGPDRIQIEWLEDIVFGEEPAIEKGARV